MDSLIGQTIRGYVLKEKIGIGGFAAVFRAYQPSVERDVAIKIILPQFANDPQFVRGFETEAQMIARLEHPYIVPLYDFWREPNSVYLIMRWLRGGSLWEALHDEGPWSLADTANLLDQVAAALTTAHRQGVIHQDIKPPNILLDKEKNAYLADFGIARDVVRSQRAEQMQPTFGTPAYLPPERFNEAELSPQTDIYSLGIVIYELLMGQTPFSAPTLSQLLSQINTAPLPPLSQQRPEFPIKLDIVLARATAKVPHLRYPDAVTMAAEFRHIVDQHVGDFSTAPEAKAAVAEETSPNTVPLEFSAATMDLTTASLPLQVIAPTNPYKGLRPFDEADAADFFGREALVQRLMDRMSDQTAQQFLAVVGPSGSGKSSVVKAGLLPRIRRGELPGSDTWFIAKMVPSTDPFQELESALLNVAFDSSKQLLDELRADEHGLLNVTRRILPGDDARLVLIIDQFEELFTLVTDETVRHRFLDSLSVAAQADDSPVFIVITLRADYYDRPLHYPSFGRIMSQTTEIVLPLTTTEQQAAITEPARRVGLELEDGLATQIMGDVLAQPGALPLLQYALTELFARRENNRLTLDIYHQSGGVTGAVARRAEQLYEELSPVQQHATQQLFLRLVSLRDGTGDTRRRATWGELTGMEQDTNTNIREVLDHYQTYRLLTFDRDPQTREPTVEIAHEALIQQWPRMQTWIADNREQLHIQQQLAIAVNEWLDADKNPGYLAARARLTRFETLLDASALALTQDEHAFLTASIAQRQRVARRRQQVISILIVLTVAAVGLAVFAAYQRNQAEDAREQAVVQRDRADQQAWIARSRELAITALNQPDQFDLALLLSVEAFAAAETLEAHNSLYTNLQAADYLETFLHGNTSPVRTLAFSPNGERLVAGGRDGTLTMWEATTHQTVELPITYEGKRLNSLVFSPDGERLAAVDNSGLLWVWHLPDGQLLYDPILAHDDPIWSTAFSPDGETIATGSADGTIRLWQAATGEAQGDALTYHAGIVLSVAFSPDGSLLASGGDDSLVYLWHLEDGELLTEPLAGHLDAVYSVAFSPDGRVLASGSADRTIRLWSTATGSPQGDPLVGHLDTARSVTFSPDGLLVVSGSEDGSVRIWDRMSGSPVIAPLNHHAGAIWSVAFSNDNNTIASGDTEGQVILWALDRYSQLGRIVPAHDAAVLAVAASPDGQLLASGSGNPSGISSTNAIRVWDTQTGALITEFDEHAASVTSLAFNPSSDWLAAGSADGSLLLWQVAVGETVTGTACETTSPILSLAFSPEDSILAVGHDDGTISLCESISGAHIASLGTANGNSVFTLVFDPVRDVLLAGYRDGAIRVWDTQQAKRKGELWQAHDDAVTSLALAGDGSLLASGSRDTTIMLWDIDTRQPQTPPLTGHTNWVLSVAFSPNADWLVSGDRDGRLMVWHTLTGRAIGNPLRLHTDWVTGVTFVPHSDQVVTGSWDRTLGWWTLDVNAWVTIACQIANRGLTADETQRFFAEFEQADVCHTF